MYSNGTIDDIDSAAAIRTRLHFCVLRGTGYGAVLLGLRTGMGDIRALFLDISVNYGLLSTLHDHGPTLVDADRVTSLGSVNVGECELPGVPVVVMLGRWGVAGGVR